MSTFETMGTSMVDLNADGRVGKMTIYSIARIWHTVGLGTALENYSSDKTEASNYGHQKTAIFSRALDNVKATQTQVTHVGSESSMRKLRLNNMTS